MTEHQIKIAALCMVLALTSAFPALAAPAAPQEQRPYSCRLLDDAQRQCAFGACDKRVIDRLTKECLRDGGRP